MFEICEFNPFDGLSKEADHHGGKNSSLINKQKKLIYLSIFLVITFDSEDDFEVV